MRSDALAGWAVPGAALVLAVLAQPMAGQEAERRLRGRVVHDDRPAAGIEVVLHRVGMDTSGAVDTTRAGKDGAFSFRLPDTPGTEGGGIYFAAASFRDVLYFGDPISGPEALDSAYVLEVHDTTAAPEGGVDLPVSIRHLIVERSGGGWRITDLIQLRNPNERTYVAADSAPTWTYPLPPGARSFEVGQSDLSAEGTRLVGHSVEVTSPIPPGERFFLFRYDVPSVEMALPVSSRTERLEILVREPAPELEASGLRRGDPVEMEGSTYRRYAAADLSGTTVRLREADPREEIPGAWIAAALALVLAAGAYLGLRRSSSTPEAAVPTGNREAILREIALLDEEFGDDESLSAEERERYEARRAALKKRLASHEPRG